MISMFEFLKKVFSKKASQEIKEEVPVEKEISREEFLLLKRKAKRKAKRSVKKKFVVGNHYYFKSKAFPFELKQFIYSVNRQVVNKVIVKPLFDNDLYTEFLSVADCKRYHIKYEPGLVILSMNLNWRLM